MYFPSPFTVVYTKVAPPPFTNFVTYPLCFFTAYKSYDVVPFLAGTMDSKNPDPYYFHRNQLVNIGWQLFNKN